MAVDLGSDGVFRPSKRVTSLDEARERRRQEAAPTSDADAVSRAFAYFGAALASPSTYDVELRASLLATPRRGKPPAVLPVLANIRRILTFDRRWAGVLAWDEFRSTVVLLRPPPFRRKAPRAEWNDADEAATREWLQLTYELDVKPMDISAAVELAAVEAPFHSVRTYLRSLRWDGRPRLDAVLSTHLGCDDTDWTRVAGPKFFLSAVARVFDPGCQVDTMLVLEGPQGFHKSSAVETLAGSDAYAWQLAEIGSRDAATQLLGVWLYELGEMDALEGVRVEKTKAFISARFDRHVGKWKRYAERVERQNVFVGTGNRNDYLRDATGARRFHPVAVVRDIDIAKLVADRDQLWAEAVARYEWWEALGRPKDAFLWWLTADETKLAQGEQEGRSMPTAEDAMLPYVKGFLETGGKDGGPLAWCHVHHVTSAIYGGPEKVGDKEVKLVVACLVKLGWKRQKDSIAGPDGRREWRYRPKAGMEEEAEKTTEESE